MPRHVRPLQISSVSRISKILRFVSEVAAAFISKPEYERTTKDSAIFQEWGASKDAEKIKVLQIGIPW